MSRHSYHKIRRTNDAGTCVWCGNKLHANEFGNPEKLLGPYKDGFFCTMRCGQRFGIAVARNGYRLKPYSSDDEAKS